MDFASKIHARGHPRAACEPPIFSDNSRPGREGKRFFFAACRQVHLTTTAKGVAAVNFVHGMEILKLLKKLDQNF